MKVWIQRHASETTMRVVAEFTMHDMARVALDRTDLAMLMEPIRSGADILLDAELIARRLEQQDAAASVPKGTDS